MYLAIVKTENNRVAKYQPYVDEADAQLHIQEYGGIVWDAGDDAINIPNLFVDGLSVTISPPEINLSDFPLTKVQFQTAIDANDLRPAIEAVLDGMPKTTAEEKLAWSAAKNSFLHANPIHRDNPLFDAMKDGVGMTDAQIDAMWMAAKDL